MSKVKYSLPSIITSIDDIKEELENIGFEQLDDIANENSKCLLINKVISYADVVTKGKCRYTSKNKEKKGSFSKETIEERCRQNTRFYVENKDMIDFEWKNRKSKVFFCQTKQSNIALPKEFFQFLDAGEDSRTRTLEYLSKDNGYDVKLVNRFIDGYFDLESTNKLLRSYGRKEDASKVSLGEGEYTECQISFGKHGIGRSDDELFHSLRCNIFAKDSIYILLVKNNGCESKGYKVYIMPYRNVEFFIKTNRDIPLHAAEFKNKTEKESIKENRKYQGQWRKHLASLYILQSIDYKSIIECPFTGLKVEYPSEFTIMRASHIKAYKDCKDVKEAYDIYNGFLLSANADALFDKYLLSVNPETLRIECSNAISPKLKSEIHLNKTLSKRYVNKEVVKYLEYHYDKFLKSKK